MVSYHYSLLTNLFFLSAFSGSIQEPYLKIVKVLRSLGFEATKDNPLLTVNLDLQGLIGQQSHKLPNVFSFFKSEYQPAG